MRVCVIAAPGRVALQTRPTPATPPGYVLVKVHVCGICGSDVAVWQGSGHKPFPYSPGHEFCGMVEEVAAGVRGLTMGQRVVVNPNLGCGECPYCRRGRPNLCDFLKARRLKSNGGLADYVALDHRMVHALPDALPDGLATFIEPLSCALHTVHVAHVRAGDRVAVFGAGAMGSLVGVVLAPRAADVFFIEPAEARREQIGRILSVPALSPTGLGASEQAADIDVAIECSGSAHALAQAIGILRKGGRLVLSGLVTRPHDAAVPFSAITTKELDVRGAWLSPETFEAAIDLALSSRELLARFETETFPLDCIEEAFDRAADPQAPKVLVTA